MLSIGVILIGCAGAQQAFNEAKEIDSSSAYTEFIEKYPDSKLVEAANKLKTQALEREEENMFERCESQLTSAPSDAYSCFKNMLTVYPNNQRTQQILETNFVEILIIGKLSVPADVLNSLPKSSQYNDTVKMMANIEIHDARSRIKETYKISSKTIASISGEYVNFDDDETIEGKQAAISLSPTDRDKFFFWKDVLFIKEGVSPFSGLPEIGNIYRFHSMSFAQIDAQVFSDRTTTHYGVYGIHPKKVSTTSQVTTKIKTNQIIQPIKLFFHPFILSHGEPGKFELSVGQFDEKEYEQFVSTLKL